MPPILINLLGIVAILGLAFLLSTGKRRIRLRVVGPAFALQALLALLILGTPWGRAAIQGMASGVSALLSYADRGTEFLFGASADNPLADTFALGALPVIIFFASLVSILYYLGIMQQIVRWLGGAIGWVTGISRVESLGAAANIFVGQSESPLVVRPYLAALPPSGLFTLMTVGMAGVAGTILAAYAGLLGDEYLPYLLAAAESLEGDHKAANIIEAAAQGAQTGVRLAVAVGAMVLAFVALVALANGIMGGIGGWFGQPDLSFQGLLGYLFAPFMFLLGIPWGEAQIAGGLFGTKIVLNEFVAFIDLGAMEPGTLSERTQAIVTFALCGFANFSSIAIQMAVTGGLAPNQRPLIAKLGLRALAAGSLSNLMSAALAGLFLSL